MQGPESAFDLGEDVAKVIYQPILRSYRLTVACAGTGTVDVTFTVGEVTSSEPLECDKNGALAGYQSYMAFDPTSTFGIVLLGNTSGGTAGDALTTAGRELLGALRKKSTDRSHFPAPPPNLKPTCP